MAEQVMNVDSEEPNPDLVQSDDWGFITDSGQWAVFRVSEERAREALDNHQYGTLVKNIRSDNKYETVSQKGDAHTINPSGVSEEEQTRIASMESEPNGWGSSMWARTGDYLSSITNIFGGSDEELETQTETSNDESVTPGVSEQEVNQLRDDVASLHSLVADLQEDLAQLQEDVNAGGGVVELIEEHTGEDVSPDEVADQLLSGSVESTESSGTETETSEESEEEEFTLDKPPMDEYDYDVDEENLPELSELEKVILTDEEQGRYQQLQAALGPLPNIGWANPFVERDDLSSDDLSWYEDIKQVIESARLKGIDPSEDKPLKGVTEETTTDKPEDEEQPEKEEQVTGEGRESEEVSEDSESEEMDEAEGRTEKKSLESDESEERDVATGGADSETHGNGMKIHTGPSPDELNSFDVDEDLEEKLTVDILTFSESERTEVQLYRARKMKAARDQGLL